MILSSHYQTLLKYQSTLILFILFFNKNSLKVNSHCYIIRNKKMYFLPLFLIERSKRTFIFPFSRPNNMIESINFIYIYIYTYTHIDLRVN